jgi:hypothetical protein
MDGNQSKQPLLQGHDNGNDEDDEDHVSSSGNKQQNESITVKEHALAWLEGKRAGLDVDGIFNAPHFKKLHASLSKNASQTDVERGKSMIQKLDEERKLKPQNDGRRSADRKRKKLQHHQDRLNNLKEKLASAFLENECCAVAALCSWQEIESFLQRLRPSLCFSLVLSGCIQVIAAGSSRHVAMLDDQRLEGSDQIVEGHSTETIES